MDTEWDLDFLACWEPLPWTEHAIETLEKLGADESTIARFWRAQKVCFLVFGADSGECDFCEAFAMKRYRAGCAVHAFCVSCAYAWTFMRNGGDVCVCERVVET